MSTPRRYPVSLLAEWARTTASRLLSELPLGSGRLELEGVLIRPGAIRRLASQRQQMTPAGRNEAWKKRRTDVYRHTGAIRTKAQSGALLDMSSRKLLRLYGQGYPVPGGGSAYALTASLAARLAETVIRITRRRSYLSSSGHHLGEAVLALHFIRPIARQLEHLHDLDAEVFADLMRNKILAEELPGDEYLERKKREALRPAITVPLTIAELSLLVGAIGIIALERGYQGARGDSTGAALMALSAAHGAARTALGNLRSFGDEEWDVHMRSRARSVCKLARQFEDDLWRMLEEFDQLEEGYK